MTIEKLSSLVSRLFFFGAFALLAVAVTEKVSNALGYTIGVSPGRFLEFAVSLLIFVLALLLREVREGLRKA